MSNASLLIVASCQFSRAFSEVYLYGTDAQEIGSLTETNEKTKEKETVMKFYRPSDDVLVGTVTDNPISLHFASDVAHKVR